MRRWLLRLAASISLLLCGGAIWLKGSANACKTEWVFRHEIAAEGKHHRVVWTIENGSVLSIIRSGFFESDLTDEQIDVLRQDIARQPRFEWHSSPVDPNEPPAVWQGFSRTEQRWAGGTREVAYVLPHRVLITVFAILPVYWAGKQLRSRIVAQRRVGPPRKPSRRLTIAAAASLLLWTALSLAWVQSEFSGMQGERAWMSPRKNGFPTYTTVSFLCAAGHVRLAAVDGSTYGDVMPDPAELTQFQFSVQRPWDLPAVPADMPSVGFGEARISYDLRSPDWTFVVEASCWVPWLLTAVLPAWWLSRRRGWIGRWPPGACARCGYDLRGGNTRCPECGSVSVSNTAAFKSSQPDTSEA